MVYIPRSIYVYYLYLVLYNYSYYERCYNPQQNSDQMDVGSTSICIFKKRYKWVISRWDDQNGLLLSPPVILGLTNLKLFHYVVRTSE